MASIRIHAAGKLSRRRHSLLPQNKPVQSISTNLTKKTPHQFPCASVAASNQTILPTHRLHEESTEPVSNPNAKTDDHLGKIDSWVQVSVSDIVKNLKQAPLLVQIYSEFDGGIEIRTERAVSEEWSAARDGWRSGESKSPDGLIYVEELERESDENGGFGEGTTKAWGIVVQGKGAECGPACYLLKTDRVCAGLGLGFCTHFCLMRVKNFRDSALEQFKDSWLLR